MSAPVEAHDPQPRPKWSLREATIEDRDGILALRSLVFGIEDPEKRSPAFWEWEFMQNPRGPARIYVAEDEGTIVGHYAIIPQKFSFPDRTPVMGSIVVDVMTHPAYRFQGMFKKIGRFALTSAADTTVFATGYPIRKEVMPGHLSIGWTAELQIPVLLKPLRWSSLAKRFGLPGGRLYDVMSRIARWRPFRAPMPTGWTIRALTTEDVGAMADVATTFAEEDLIHQIRDADFLRYRYFSNPLWPYEAWGLYAGQELAAYVVSRESKMLDTASLAIVDMACNPSGGGAVETLVRHVLAEAATRDLAVAGAMITKGNRYHRALRRAGMFPGPHKFNLILFALQADFSDSLVDPKNKWFLNWGDTDDV